MGEIYVFVRSLFNTPSTCVQRHKKKCVFGTLARRAATTLTSYAPSVFHTKSTRTHIYAPAKIRTLRRVRRRRKGREGVKPTLVDRFEGGLLLRVASYIAHP